MTTAPLTEMELEAAKTRQAIENAALLADCETRGAAIFVRFGFAQSGHCSRNNRDGCSEAGLSVYRGWRMPDGRVVLDMREADLMSYLFGGFAARRSYIATGSIAGNGADGEPLLGRFRLRRFEQDEIEVVI